MNGSDNYYPHYCRLCNKLIGHFTASDPHDQKYYQRFCDDCITMGAPKLDELLRKHKIQLRIKSQPSSFLGRFFLRLVKLCG